MPAYTTIITSIKESYADGCRQYLRDHVEPACASSGARFSPQFRFDLIPTLHFCSFSVLNKEDEFGAYLVFEATFDGSREDFLSDLLRIAPDGMHGWLGGDNDPSRLELYNYEVTPTCDELATADWLPRVRPTDLMGRGVAFGPAQRIGGQAELPAGFAVHDHEGGPFGDGHLVASECRRSEVDAKGMTGQRVDDDQRIEQADVGPRGGFGLLVELGQGHGVERAPEGEQQGDREGRAR